MEKVARDLASRFGELIAEALETAFATWHGVLRDGHVLHKKRTQAAFMWDCAIENLRNILPSEDFHFHDVGETTYIVYRDAFLLQLKKFNQSGHPASIMTSRKRDFSGQLPLGFGDDLVNVYLGYQFDSYEIKIQSVFLTCPTGRRFQWVVPLHVDGVSQADLFTGETPAVANVGNRLRLKTKEAKEDHDAV